MPASALGPLTGGERLFAPVVMADPPHPAASCPEAAAACNTSTYAGRTSQPEPAATTANSGAVSTTTPPRARQMALLCPAVTPGQV